MKALAFVIAASAALLAACGGGSGGAVGSLPPPDQASAPAGNDVPPSAQLDPQSATEFVSGIASKKSETSEPLRTGDGKDLATSETAEPAPL